MTAEHSEANEPQGRSRTRCAPDAATDALYRRLADAQAEYERYERHAEAARVRRNLLVAKLVTAGETTRAVGAVAKVTSSAVSQIMARREWERTA